MVTEAVLVLILSTADGDVLDYEPVRTFAKPKHCLIFNYHPKYEKKKLKHGYVYWHNHKEYAVPGFTITFRCKSVGPIYTA